MSTAPAPVLNLQFLCSYVRTSMNPPHHTGQSQASRSIAGLKHVNTTGKGNRIPINLVERTIDEKSLHLAQSRHLGRVAHIAQRSIAALVPGSSLGSTQKAWRALASQLWASQENMIVPLAMAPHGVPLGLILGAGKHGS